MIVQSFKMTGQLKVTNILIKIGLAQIYAPMYVFLLSNRKFDLKGLYSPGSNNTFRNVNDLRKLSYQFDTDREHIVILLRQKHIFCI